MAGGANQVRARAVHRTVERRWMGRLKQAGSAGPVDEIDTVLRRDLQCRSQIGGPEIGAERGDDQGLQVGLLEATQAFDQGQLCGPRGPGVRQLPGRPADRGDQKRNARGGRRHAGEQLS